VAWREVFSPSANLSHVPSIQRLASISDQHNANTLNYDRITIAMQDHGRAAEESWSEVWSSRAVSAQHKQQKLAPIVQCASLSHQSRKSGIARLAFSIYTFCINEV
jgi:hypothetical protein